MNDSVFFFRVTVLDRIPDFLFFLGKLLIVGLVGESVCHTLIPLQYLGLARYMELKDVMVSCQPSYLYNDDRKMDNIFIIYSRILYCSSMFAAAIRNVLLSTEAEVILMSYIFMYNANKFIQLSALLFNRYT